MGQFSMKIIGPPGSVLGANQHYKGLAGRGRRANDLTFALSDPGFYCQNLNFGKMREAPKLNTVSNDGGKTGCSERVYLHRRILFYGSVFVGAAAADNATI
jgi:hypothetical protein